LNPFGEFSRAQPIIETKEDIYDETCTKLALTHGRGHWAGGPGQSTEDVKWLDQKLKDFFESG
jgi:hypothetical protein